MINTDTLVTMIDADQNFSNVTRVVDENGLAVILKNDKPSYIMIDFDEYEIIQEMITARRVLLDQTACELFEENMKSYILELAK